jgi:oligopeptide transport system substrate-binding protein
MRIGPTRLRVAALAAAFVIGTVGVVEAEAVLHRGNGGEPATLDPQQSGLLAEFHILADMYEGLVTFAANGDVVPGVAERWEISDDGRTYTFHLRPHAKWSNGEPLTAADFVYSFRRAVDPATEFPYASTLAPIANAEAILAGAEQNLSKLGVVAKDHHTLVIKLNSRTPYFLGQLRGSFAMPVSKAVIEKFGAEWTKPGNVISNGAFVIAEWTPQLSITLVKNRHFHDAANVKLDKIIYYATEDSVDEFKQFQAGELHITYHVPADQIETARSQMAAEFKNSSLIGTYYLTINLDRKPFGRSKNLRKALALAIDRETLVEETTGLGDIPAYSYVPNVLPGYTPSYLSFKETPMDQRIARAKALIKAAGYDATNSLKVELRHPSDRHGDHKRIALAIQGMWEPLGLDVRLASAERAEHYEKLRHQKYEIGRAGWIADFADPINFLEQYTSDNQGANYPHYQNPNYDTLIERSRDMADPVERMKVLAEAERLIMDDVIIIPIFHYAANHMVSAKVIGWENNGFDVNLSRYLSLAQ